MSIREFEMSDKDGITAVFSETNAYHTALQPDVFNVLPLDSLITDKWLSDIKDAPHKNIYVCERDDEITGVVLFTRHDTDDELEKIKTYVHIGEIAVLAKHRGEGIGKLLISAVETYAKSIGAVNLQLEVWSNNTSSIKFYEKKGFKLKKHQYWKDI